MSLKRKRNSYDAQFKIKVIKFAEENDNSATDSHFAVSKKTSERLEKAEEIFIWNAQDEKGETLR